MWSTIRFSILSRRHARRRRSPRGVNASAIERLESRRLLTAIDMTDLEQLMVELINRARADPNAEAARHGIPLNQNLPANTISSDPKQPLAPNAILNTAASNHAVDMLNRDFFAHNDPEGCRSSDPNCSTPSTRAMDAGYPVGVGENIAWWGTTAATFDQEDAVRERHAGLFKSAGHRQNILLPAYEELGTAVEFGQFFSQGTNWNAIMVGNSFGNPSIDPVITGVVFNDLDGDDFFSPGEPVRSGTITATHTGTGATYTTDIGQSGAYALSVPDGTYSVVASGGAVGDVYLNTVTVGGENVKVDFELSSMTPVSFLTIAVNPAIIDEDGGQSTATITRFGNTTTSLVVTLSGSDAGELTVPGSVTIPANQTSRTVTLTAVNDSVADGDQTVTVTASAGGFDSAMATVTVTDDDLQVPTLTGPSGATPESKPEFTWMAAAGADYYELAVDNLTTGQTDFIRQQQLTGTTYTSPTDLPLGRYSARIRAVTTAGLTSAWSPTVSFTVKTSPALTSPASTVAESDPAFQWTSVAGAVMYDLWVDDISGGQNEFIRVTDLTTTTYTPTLPLPVGSFRAWIRAINAEGIAANWSSQTNFLVRTPPTGNVPQGSVTPDYTMTWSAVAGVIEYDLWVNNLSTGQSQVIRETALAPTAFAPVNGLDIDRYRFWVRGRNAAGIWSYWSAPVTYRVAAAPTITSPTASTLDRTPTINWTAVAGAAEYDVWINNVTTNAQQVVRNQSVADTSLTVPNDLTDGLYRVWVRAINSAGEPSTWSSRRDFEVGGAPVLTAPLSSTTDTTPTFVWTLVDGADRYQLWVNNDTTGQTRVVYETGLPSTFHTAITSLTPGTHRAWVRAIRADGTAGRWSAPLEFTIQVATSSVRPEALRASLLS